MNKKPLVAIIMGSDSDLPILKKAEEVLKEFTIPYEITIVSAHRTPDRMMEYSKQAHERGLKVIIAGAGGAAHLPGMVASLTTLPVIGVPVHSTNSLQGIDSLLSIVQMPGGIPVATVGVDNARNAGLLAVRMLALSDSSLFERLRDFMSQQTKKVLQKVKKMEKKNIS
ncbi:MAG: 5-(carboxyamino)imidazole ribonucleotide mutase [Candidatus Altimarinota bacterium]